MKSMIIAFAVLSIAANVSAAPLPTCKITTLKDARNCMAAVAKAYPSYEEPNEFMASANKLTLKKVLKALGKTKRLQALEQADFVGAMLEHGDEHHLYYFIMTKGTAKPTEIYDLNLVDLAYELKSPVTLKELFLGTSFDGSDVREDIEAALEEFNDARR